LDLAKNGTLMAPSQLADQTSWPVSIFSARTTSAFLSWVSVVMTNPPVTIGPE
jgi:hypothetical protein